ncbi:MAG: hypothetical protein J7K33_10665 [Candidatus Marinimicrobia bacterium]|nr:hypothetical protein [Candidatus Neomarinimicrobiota bacterium]
MKFDILKFFAIIVVVLSFSGCTTLEKFRYNVITVIGIDKTGSFIRKGEENKKQLIGKIVYQIVKEKAELQKKDKTGGLRKVLGGIGKFERVIICPISFRGPGGIKLFLIFDDDPLFISKTSAFVSPQRVKNLIFPKRENPHSRTDFLQFFDELKSIYGNIERIRVNYILITDGLPDPTGAEKRYSEEITSQQLINTYGNEYIKKMDKILPENIKIMFIGVDANILEFWNYVTNNIKKNRRIKIQLVASSLEQMSEKKIREIVNPYSW